MDSTTLAWAALVLAIPVLLAVDVVAMRGARGRSLRRAAVWSIIWTALGLAFAAVLWALRGSADAEAYLAGFLVEKTLSLDNLAVFATIFAALRIPLPQQRRVLLPGIAAAVVLRGAFIVVGAALLNAFGWLLYVFGAFLVWTAWRMARGGGHVDLERSRALRLLRRVVPVSPELDGEHFTTRAAGRLALTPLALALALVAVFDVVFALDSIPAIFGITRDAYIVFAANAFSLLGMAALYGVLSSLLERFVHLNAGLALVLAFIGAKMLLVDVYHVPTVASLAGILAILGGSILTSALAGRRRRPEERGRAVRRTTSPSRG